MLNGSDMWTLKMFPQTVFSRFWSDCYSTKKVNERVEVVGNEDENRLEGSNERVLLRQNRFVDSTEPWS